MALSELFERYRAPRLFAKLSAAMRSCPVTAKGLPSGRQAPTGDTATQDSTGLLRALQAAEAQVVPECVGAGSTATSLRICHTMEAAKQLASE